MKYVLLAAGLVLARGAAAQSAPPVPYEFLTLYESESQQNSLAKILFAPAFQGKTELPLESLPGAASGTKYLAAYQKNLVMVNQQLEAVTAAGWELVHVSSVDQAREYLFRRRKP